MSHDATRRQVLAGAAAACGAAVAGSTPTRGATGPTSDSRTGTDTGQSDDLASTVRDALEDALDEHDANGATVAVVEGGEPVLTEGFGHAYYNPDVSVDPESTPFRIGSVSKVFTYVAAMRLVDEGRVDPDAPVAESLESVEVPDQNAYDEPVTLAHLATHTSGFDQRSPGQFQTSLDDLRSLPTALRANDPERIHPPGELPTYTNYNTGLAGQLVADVLGTEYASAVQQLVFDPLEMDGSTFDPLPDALLGGRSDVPDDLYWYSEMTPASGMSATATDVARFISALVGDGSVEGGRVLSPSGVEALHRQWHTPHERLAGSSFGMERQRRDGRLVVGHHGGVPDFSTDLRLFPEEDVGLFVSVHGDGADPNEVQSAVTEAFLDHVAPVSGPEAGAGGTSIDADEFAGRYRTVLVTDSVSVEKPRTMLGRPDTMVRVDGGELVTERRGTTHRWVAVDDGVFRRTDGGDTLVFRDAADGGVHLFRASVPRTPLERVPWYGGPGLQRQLALVAGLAVLSGGVGWPLAAGWRRVRGGSAVPETLSRGRMAAGGSTLALVGFGILGVVAVVGGWLRVHPPGFGLMFALPVVGAAFALGAAGFALRAWRRDEGSLPARVHLAVVVAGLAVLYGLFRYWNLLRLTP